MKFLYPVAPTFPITQTFAEHEQARISHGWASYNGGIDWGIPNGTSIRAAQSGIVTVARGDTDGYGTHIRIETTDGATKYLAIYGHMQSFSVSIGQQVQVGQEIGLSDNTGNSTGPHLHFELRQNGTPIDPFPLLVKTVAEITGSSSGSGTSAGGTTTGGTSSGGTTSGGTSSAGTSTGAGTEPAQFPALPKITVLSATLNIRTAAGAANPKVGSLTSGTQVEVIRKVMKGTDVWAQIGYQQFVAVVYQGEALAKWS
jgi:hypothetical protein